MTLNATQGPGNTQWQPSAPATGDEVRAPASNGIAPVWLNPNAPTAPSTTDGSAGQPASTPDADAAQTTQPEAAPASPEALPAGVTPPWMAPDAPAADVPSQQPAEVGVNDTTLDETPTEYPPAEVYKDLETGVTVIVVHLSERPVETPSSEPANGARLTEQPGDDRPPNLPGQAQPNTPEMVMSAEFIAGMLLGDFVENPSMSAIAGQVLLGEIPVLGTLGDVRDLVKSIGDLVVGKDGALADVGLNAAGFLPAAGTFKGARKIAELIKNGDNVTGVAIHQLERRLSADGRLIPSGVERLPSGKLPSNFEWAGRKYQGDTWTPDLDHKYPDGVIFTPDGFPDFSPHAVHTVTFDPPGFAGNYGSDFAEANRRMDLDETPDGYVWHHHQDTRTMLLIPEDLHEGVRHAGGIATAKGRK